MRKTIRRPVKVYKEARARLDELKKMKKETLLSLKNAPESGKIHIILNHGVPQYYLRTEKQEKNGKYIPKSEIEKIRKHLQKSYDEKIIRAIENEILILEAFLKKADKIKNRIFEIYDSYPLQTKRFLQPIDVSDSRLIERWREVPYVGKIITEDINVFVTDQGEKVRSKSELNIANLLFKSGIPYRYECPLHLKGRIVHPDFTILNPSQRKIFYWEHRGMMDDREYSKHAVDRIKEYGKNGIFLGINLIITEETLSSPLGTDEIKRIIDAYFKI